MGGETNREKTDAVENAKQSVTNAQNRIETAESELNALLEEKKAQLAEVAESFGIDTTGKWYQDLLTSFENGDIAFSEALDKLDTYTEDRRAQIEDIKTNFVGGFGFNSTKSVGTDEEFKTIPDTLDTLQGYKDTLEDGDNLSYEDLDNLAKHSEKIADKINKKQKITASDVQEVMDGITEEVEEDLDKIEDYFQDAIDYIDTLVEKSGFGDEFKKQVEDAFQVAKEAFENGEELDFVDPSVANDTDSLTTLAQQLETLEDDYDTGRISQEDYRAGLFDLTMQMADADNKAALLSAILTGEGGVTQSWENVDIAQQNALASALGYDSAETMIAQNPDLLTFLSTMGGKWNELDQDQQNALSSLLTYISTYSTAPEQVQSILAQAAGYTKGIAYVGLTNTNVRRLGTSSPKKSGSGGSKYTAEDAAKDLADILGDIEDYETDIELDLEDQTEQFINQEMLAANRLDRLKEELDYYNDIYDVTEETSKWLETQNKLLDNQSKKVGKLQNANESINAQRQKLIDQNSKYKVDTWFDSEGNDTLAYGDLINSFEYQKNAIQQETAAKMRSVYNSVAGSTNEDAIKNAKDRIKDIEEEADRKIEALDKEQEKVENIHDSVSELNEAWLDNQEAIRDALAELHEIVISIRDELSDDIMEQLEKAVDKTNESIEKDVTRMEQLVTIQEKYNDILNETIDTQDELDSELQASLDSFEYLDEQMRQLMFNEDDYKVLSETLTGIQTDIAEIWEDHYNQINSLTEDEMYKAEYITSETERQLEMKMKEYELAKAELDVAKARTNLQNVQNERNVRMFVGGQWIWTADPNAVKDAQQQLADAEREKNKIEREAEQQTLIDEMNQIIDSDNLQIDKNNELLERIQEAIELETQEVKNISDALSNAQGEDLPALNDILQGAFGSDGGDFSTLLTEIGENSTELVELLKGTTTKEAEALLKGGTLSKKDFESLISKLGYGWDEKTGTVTTQDGSFKANYKGWKADTSKNTPLGTGENGASVTGNGKTTTNTSPSNNAGGYPKQGTVSTGSLPLRIRAGAGLNYKVLGTMPKGASVTITGEANSGWAKVQYKGINGYASKQYLTYDQGGLATGKGIFLKDINVPERVLSPQQTKSFDTLVKNLTTNPVLAALTKNIKGTSSFNGVGQGVGETKQYYFSNFTVQADNITEFIDSLEGMIPISGK